MVGLRIARGSSGILRFKALPLVDGIVELGIGIAHLPPVDEQLKAFHIAGLIGFALGKRRHLDGVIHNKGGLDQIIFTVLLKKHIENVALLMTRFIFNMVFIGKLLCLFRVTDSVKINAGVFLHGVNHGKALKGLTKVDLFSAVSDDGGAADFLCEEAEKVFCQIHHAVIIGIGLVELHQRKLRVMTGINPFITEHAADLIHSLQPADNQALEIELERNTELHILIKGVEMGFKRTCGSAACIGHQHRGLHLDEALTVQIAANAADDSRALNESVLHLGIHDEIHIALAVTHVNIGQAVILLGEDLQALGEQRYLFCMDGDFTGFGFENIALNADDIADIQLFEIGIVFLADNITCHIALHDPLEILQAAEGGLAHDVFCHHAAGDADGLPLQGVKVLTDIGTVMGLVKFCNTERILSPFLQSGKLIAPYLQKIGNILLLLDVICSFAHAVPQNQLFFTETILNWSCPAGASMVTTSPARWPWRPLPRGESSEMRPSLGFAS